MIDANELEMERTRGKHLAEGSENERGSVVRMARKRQEGRYNTRYNEIRDNQRANYLNENCKGGDRGMIAGLSDVGTKRGEIFIGGRKTVQSANYVKGQESRWSMRCANIKS